MDLYAIMWWMLLKGSFKWMPSIFDMYPFTHQEICGKGQISENILKEIWADSTQTCISCL